MWKEEKVICGVLCYRYSDDDEFIPYDILQLTLIVQKQKTKLGELKTLSENWKANAEGWRDHYHELKAKNEVLQSNLKGLNK